MLPSPFKGRFLPVTGNRWTDTPPSQCPQGKSASPPGQAVCCFYVCSGSVDFFPKYRLERRGWGGDSRVEIAYPQSTQALSRQRNVSSGMAPSLHAGESGQPHSAPQTPLSPVLTEIICVSWWSPQERGTPDPTPTPAVLSQETSALHRPEASLLMCLHFNRDSPPQSPGGPRSTQP